MIKYDESMTCRNCYHTMCLFHGEYRKPIYRSYDLCCWVSKEDFDNLPQNKNQNSDFINSYIR